MFGFKKEEEKKEKKIDYEKFYVKPHKKVSVPVTDKHIKILRQDAENMVHMCQTPHGMYPSAFAIAHPQINDKKPLRFFVTHAGEIIINPVIIKHTEYMVDSREGCMSFSDWPMVTVKRWHKIEVEYQTLDLADKLTEKRVKKLSGRDAYIYSHEIDHMDAKYIFDKLNN